MKTEPEPTRREIEEHLAKILTSQDFQSAGRLADFLQYVVTETLAGRGEAIKGYSVATSVFGRPDTFDPSRDPIVRTQAGRLRRRLEHYYLTEGADSPVRIELPKGTYMPVFRGIDESHATTSERPSASPERLHRRPLLAVFPFAHIGDTEELRHFAAGITEELSVSFSRIEGISVLGRHSAAHYCELPNAIDMVSRDLGVRFVLSGTIRKLDDRVRVSAQLTDARSHEQIWADTAENAWTSAGLFDVQDEIALRVANQIGGDYGIIAQRLIDEYRDARPEELGIYEATLLIYDYNRRPTRDAHARVLSVLRQTVAQAPRYATAWAQLGELYTDAHNLGYDAGPDPLSEAERCAKRALAEDQLCQQAISVAAYVHFSRRAFAEAIEMANRTIEANPGNSYQLAWSGFILGLSGELERGRKIIEDAELCNPLQPGWLRLVSLLYNLDQDDFEGVLHEAHRFHSPALGWDPLLRAAAGGLAGKAALARSAYAELATMFPEVTEDLESYVRAFVVADGHVDLLLKGLGLASRGGFPRLASEADVDSG